MKRRRIAIVGFGKLGRACAKDLLHNDELSCAGIVRRPEHVMERLPAGLEHLSVVAHVGELQAIDAAFICVPAEQVASVALELMQRKLPVVECAVFHGEAWQRHKDTLDRCAQRHRTVAIVGAGWDPGALSLLRALFALLIPKGETEVSHRPGIDLHHTILAHTIPGVRHMLATERRSTAGIQQHYVYVELEDGAEFRQVEETIRNEPLFFGEEALIFQVDSIARLEEEGHGVVLERRGSTGETSQSILLEARFAEPVLSAQLMLAAARALPLCRPGAHSLFDVCPAALWGEARRLAERNWV